MIEQNYRVLLIDGCNLAYRFFHAALTSKQGLMVNKERIPISVCKAFIGYLESLYKKYNPTHIVIAFDEGKENYRHKLYPNYKQNRKPLEKQDSLDVEIRNLKLILKEKDISVLSFKGYEADDIINTLTIKAIEQKAEVIIVSNDGDLLQLVSDRDRVSCLRSGFNTQGLYKEQDVINRYSVKPFQLADYKAIVGDSSDNIPGVKGIGKVGASHLLNQYSNVEEIIDNLENIETKYKNKIEPQVKDLRLYKKLIELGRIDTLIDNYSLEMALIIEEIEQHTSIMSELGI